MSPLVGIGAVLAILMAIFVIDHMRDDYDIAMRVLAECQAELPRNQTCELVARQREEG